MIKKAVYDLSKFRHVVRNNQLIVMEKSIPEIYGAEIIFTGELSEYDRSSAELRARALGAKVKGTVTKSLDFVVVGMNPGSKLKDAIKAGAEVITDEQWNALADQGLKY